MYQLNHLTGNTYYIDSPTNVGLYIKGMEAFLIDSGNDKDAAKKYLGIINEKGYTLKAIINTHSHSDHIGGNAYLSKKTNCKIYAHESAVSFIRHPEFEPAFTLGGYPYKDLQNKYFIASPSEPLSVGDFKEEGFEILSLYGHAADLIGIKTPDGICFIGDGVIGNEIIEKYHIFFLYDVKAYLKKLEYLKTIKCNGFVPSHGEPVCDISPLADLNKNKVLEIAHKILEICKTPTRYEDILEKLFSHYHLHMNMTQYALVGSTVRSYLSYLYNEGKLITEIKDNRVYWEGNNA